MNDASDTGLTSNIIDGWRSISIVLYLYIGIFFYLHRRQPVLAEAAWNTNNPAIIRSFIAEEK